METAMDTAQTTAAPKADIKQMSTLAEFYPFYLGEHSNLACRRVMYKDMWTGKVKVL